MDGDEGFSQLAAMNSRRVSSAGKADKAFRFTQDTQEYKLLKKLVETGKVKPSDRPSDIKDMYEIFAKITSNSFRSQFNKLKNQFGVNTKAGKEFVLYFGGDHYFNLSSPDYYYLFVLSVIGTKTSCDKV